MTVERILMRTRWLAFFVLTACFILLPGVMNASNADTGSPLARPSLSQVANKIESDVLATLQRGGSARVLIVMAEQADVSAAQNLTTKQAKGRYVYATLRATADRTQAPVLALLERQGLAYRPYYIVNAIAVENLGAQDAALIAAQPEVGRITGDPDVRLNEPVVNLPAAEAAHGVEWGLAKIRADRMWAAGFKGKGIVVANQDTGVQWDHPALLKHYRGYNKQTGKVRHSHNWWDAIHNPNGSGGNVCGFNLRKPCDDYGHGTHTMGTLVGKKAKNKIGVAPKARWIACRDMDDGVGRPSTYIECFEFFLAPWNKKGKHPNPDRAPDVVSNSWGCPPSELCVPDSLRTATKNVRAAGIFVSVSAGNSGSSCGSVNEPAAIYDAATTVGATDSSDTLAGFSSRGPVIVDGSNRLKPDISAPGVNVRSAYPPNSYEVMSGTSMAAPHVAGAVALLWQAVPRLRGDVAQTEAVLFNSAQRAVHVAGNQICGGTAADMIPNNLFGYGRLDVWRAYQLAH
jgi:serine protease AprX